MKTRLLRLQMVLAFVLASLCGAGTAAAEVPTTASLAERTPAPISFARDAGALRGELTDPLAPVREKALRTGGDARLEGKGVEVAYIRDLYGPVLAKVSKRLESTAPPLVMNAVDYEANHALVERVLEASETPLSPGSVAYDGHIAVVRLPDRVEAVAVEDVADPASVVDHDALLKAALKMLPKRFEVARVRPDKVKWDGTGYVIVEGVEVIRASISILRPAKQPDTRVATQ